jgi:acyl-CoA synthetase (AMP-forming)/AMP-acid ligase II
VSSSLELCEVLLDVAKVALVPGEGFGAPGYVRLSYACPTRTSARAWTASSRPSDSHVNVADLVASAATPSTVGAPRSSVPGDDRITWSELDRAVDRGAPACCSTPASAPGSGSPSCSATPRTFAVAYWATLRCGAVLVPVNPAYTEPEQAHIFTDADVRAVVADPRLHATAGSGTRWRPSCSSPRPRCG